MYNNEVFSKKYLPNIIIIVLIFFLGSFLRLYKIDFGRPESFLFDENDVYDDVIRFSQNYKFIISQDGFMGFEPMSYVYGMFPTYFLTLSTIFLNKFTTILNINFNFDFYFVYLRIVTSIFSLLGIVFTGLIYKKVFKDKKGFILSLFLAAINWKLIAQSHYINHDTYLMVFTISSIYFFINYLNDRKCWNLFLSASLLGFAAGTKITALIISPLLILALINNRDFKALLFLILGVLTGFGVSNPFSIINFPEFSSRVLSMRETEAGIIFGDINFNPLRYPISLVKLLTPTIFFAGIYEVCKIGRYFYINVRKSRMGNDLIVHLILILTPITYIIFFSLTPRMTERWMTPIIPILIVYASKGLIEIFDNIKNYKFACTITVFIFAVTTLVYPLSLVKQLQVGKPRVTAYKWVKGYLNDSKNNEYKILMYTNKGDRDPFSNIKSCDLKSFKVYESKGAQNFYPKDPADYDMVILYSYIDKNFRNSYVKYKYPEYFKAWDLFTSTVRDPSKFTLLKTFKTTKLNLLGVPEISIYEKIK